MIRQAEAESRGKPGFSLLSALNSLHSAFVLCPLFPALCFSVLCSLLLFSVLCPLPFSYLKRANNGRLEMSLKITKAKKTTISTKAA